MTVPLTFQCTTSSNSCDAFAVDRCKMFNISLKEMNGYIMFLQTFTVILHNIHVLIKLSFIFQNESPTWLNYVFVIIAPGMDV